MRPVIAEKGYEFIKDQRFNTLNIRLDASPKSNLAWDSLETEVEMALKLSAKISFELDFGFTQEGTLFRDPANFFARGLGLSQFEEKAYRVYKEHITSIILYRGSGCFTPSIKKDASLYSDFLDWKKDLFGSAEITHQMFRIFSMEIFMQYLHRLGAPLLEDLPVVALFDFSDIPKPSYQAELLSQTFFPYIVPGVKGATVAFNGFGWEGIGNLGYIGTKAIILPSPEVITLGIVIPEVGDMPYEMFDAAIATLQRDGVRYKCFPEVLITDNWSGLDRILIFPDRVSENGMRMLQGFQAADGKVITDISE